MIFDTHIHWDDDAFDEDRDELLSGLKEAGMITVNAGCSIPTSEAGIRLASKYDEIYALVGVHPHDAAEMTDADYALLEEMLKQPKVVGVGEIGLDYHYEGTDKAAQKDCFCRQLAMAKSADMPISIHSRDTAADTLDIMKAEASSLGGVIHCFSYSKEMAKEYLDMGYYLGIGGVITFKNSKKLVEVVEYAPLSQLVLETDAPYLSPEPYRGKRNSSYNLPYVVSAIARIKGVTEKEVEDITWANAHKMYRLGVQD